ncbi:MAG: ABC transporter ATP-binding protein [Proteobacteria bacterium]|nr:ABC transporter ATP-binding protein [Pseudomonadota bacterium]
MLFLNNIEVMYMNVILVLKSVSFEVGAGCIVALLGANGAGKTTCLKAISGLLKTEEGRITEGDIEFEGRRLNMMDPNEIVQLGIVQVLEGRKMCRHFTAEENLKVAGYYGRNRGLGLKDDIEAVYAYFPRLKDLRHNTSGFLSGGEQQMLLIGRAMMAHPKLMLLDEPSLGLSPVLVEEIFRIIKKINAEEGASVLLVEQNAIMALNVASHGYVMENGRIVLEGPADKLRDNEDIKEFYLGLSQLGQRKSYREIKHYRRRKRWLA